jgi:hypothetical protein
MKLAIFWRNLGSAVVYYPTLAKVTGGGTATIFFLQLVGWQSQQENPDDWLRVTVEEIQTATGLNSVEQSLARKLLKERSLLKERQVTAAINTLELWLDLDIFEQQLAALSNPNISDSLSHNNKALNSPVEVVQTSSKQAQDEYFGLSRSPRSVTVKYHNYRFSGPWENDEQFEQFQAALLDYAKEQGIYQPADWVFKIIDGITKGMISPFWNEFIAGIPLGETQKVKREWEIEPGIPYPAFEEERIQYYVHKGEPIEAAVSRTRRDLRDPVLGKDLWEGFLRKCDRIADEAIKAKKLGVSTAYLPPSFTNKPQITKESVMNKLASVAPEFTLASSNQTALPESNPEPQPDDEIPSLAALQATYKTPIGKTIVEQQIAQHPEWGYGIVDSEVVDVMPF